MDTNKIPSLGDRYSDWSVIVVTLLTVLLGWLLMSNVQSRAVPFDAGGVTGQMPAGWVTDLAEAGVVLHTAELGGSGFSTAYQLEVIPVASDVSPADVASFYSVERAQNLRTPSACLTSRMSRSTGRTDTRWPTSGDMAGI